MRKCTFSPYILTFFHFGPYILFLLLLAPKPISASHFSPSISQLVEKADVTDGANKKNNIKCIVVHCSHTCSAMCLSHPNE